MLQDEEDTEALVQNSGSKPAAMTDETALKQTGKGAPDIAPASALAAKAAEKLAKEEKEPMRTFDIGSPPSSCLEAPSGQSPGAIHEIPELPQASLSSSAVPSSSSSATDESTSPSSGVQKMMTEAFPVDKMQNGMNAAKSLWSWGFKKVAEGANKLSDEISKSEFAKETERLAQQAGQKIEQGANEVARLAEQSATKIGEKLEKDVQPALQETGKHMEEAARKSQEKASELAEKMQPKLKEAGETAKTSLFSAMGSAAKTAIWFQSLGSTRDHSSEEEDFCSSSPAPATGTNATASASNPPIAKAPGFEYMPEARNSENDVSAKATVVPSVAEKTALSQSTSSIVEETIKEQPTPAPSIVEEPAKSEMPPPPSAVEELPKSPPTSAPSVVEAPAKQEPAVAASIAETPAQAVESSSTAIKTPPQVQPTLEVTAPAVESSTLDSPSKPAPAPEAFTSPQNASEQMRLKMEARKAAVDAETNVAEKAEAPAPVAVPPAIDDVEEF